MVLRIGYVREHFCSPLLQFEEEDKGSTFTLIECPSGTGQLISRLTNDEIDIAMCAPARSIFFNHASNFYDWSRSETERSRIP
ncbi:hypothetical protein AZE42_11460 [Rhizopogon vesiculosus]|uniref:LysR substrate-binding domain-containing protein n=1 Tax=Rhizopogon vesiculosus TaxID=180088 RepID=A0A1J8QEW0_9AGAM|nr:hypothetical protein AZE42_11460 [Rhizopogon vesiculosus]